MRVVKRKRVKRNHAAGCFSYHVNTCDCSTFIAMLAVLLAAAICVVCVIFSDFIAAFSILLVGGKLLLRGLVSFPYSLSGALMITGCGLLGIGCAILLYLLGIYLCKWTGMLLVMLARK